MQQKMPLYQRQRHTAGAACKVLLTLGLAGATALAWADQDVQSADGLWKAHAKVAESLPVGSASEATVTVTPGKGKGCPSASSVVFEMPAHGHGGKVAPKVASASGCTFHVTDLVPSMGGDWRLRLVLKGEGTSSNVDFAIAAK